MKLKIHEHQCNNITDVRKKILLLLLVSVGAKAQFLQFGANAGFFAKQSVRFDNPVVLDSSVTYYDVPFVLSEKLIKMKKETAPAFESYINYRYSQTRYVGLNFRYVQQRSNAIGQDTYETDYPDVTVKAPSLGVTYGYTKKKLFYSFFAEGGLAVTKLKFDFDWPQNSGHSKYENYLNQNNTFLMGFGKVGFKLIFLTVSTRLDLKVGDIRNKSGIKTITYRPTINVGMDFCSGFLGKKKFKTKNTATTLDEDAVFKENFDFGKLEFEYGACFNINQYRLKEPGQLSYSSSSTTYSPVQIQFKDKWTHTGVGWVVNLKYAPFKAKKFILGVYVTTGQANNKTSIGTYTSNSVSVSGNSVNPKTKSMEFSTNTYHVGFGPGYRFKISSMTFIDAAPLFNLVNIASFKGSDEIKNYFDWKSGFSKSVGLNVSCKSRHAGISLKVLKGTSSIEKNDRFKNGFFFSILLFGDYGFLY